MDKIIPTEFIRSIRESFNGSKTVYTQGSCYQFYLILKGIYPEAIAYYDDIRYHIYTKIDKKFYDIYGELTNEQTLNILRPLSDLPSVYNNAPTWLWSIEEHGDKINNQ